MHKNKAESECDCHDHEDCGCECDCDCGHGMGFRRQYMTHKEELAMLEEYHSQLKLELEAVEERMAELKGKKK